MNERLVQLVVRNNAQGEKVAPELKKDEQNRKFRMELALGFAARRGRLGITA